MKNIDDMELIALLNGAHLKQQENVEKNDNVSKYAIYQKNTYAWTISI